MSFLECEKGLPDFDKAVISLWFRVPRESLEAAAKAGAEADIADDAYDIAFFPTNTGYRSPLNGVVPLVMLGESQTAHAGVKLDSGASGSMIVTTGWIMGNGSFSAVYDGVKDVPNVFTETASADPHPYELPPSFIGISCRNGEVPCIVVSLQMDNVPVRTGYIYNTTTTYNGPVFVVQDEFVYDYPFDGRSMYGMVYQYRYMGPVEGYRDVTNDPPPFDGHSFWTWPPGGTIYTANSVFLDASDLFYPVPGRFGVRGPVVTSDVWHHLLISFDVGGTVVNDSSPCRMWIALDDVNFPDVGDHNTIFPDVSGRPAEPAGMPSTVWSTYGVSAHPYNDMNQSLVTNGAYLVRETQSGMASGTFTLAASKVSAASVGVPATSEFSDHIHQVQMAELQIFTGVTLDTSIEKNRRAFINSKGQPVDEAYGVAKFRGVYGPKSPNVTPSAPIKLLGRKPDVAIVRSARNWMSGFDFNRTSFRPHGKIRPVRPDPVLGK